MVVRGFSQSNSSEFPLTQALEITFVSTHAVVKGTNNSSFSIVSPLTSLLKTTTAKTKTSTATTTTISTVTTTVMVLGASTLSVSTTQSGEILSHEASNEQINASRMQILRSYKEEVLRDKFHETFPRDPKALYETFQKKKAKIKKMMRNRLIFQDQFNLMFPPTGDTVDSRKFDVKLLMVCF